MYSEMSTVIRKGEDPWPHFQASSIFDEIPNDEDFYSKLVSAEITTVTPAWREILAHLNRAFGAGEVRVDRPARVHVEHILPQSPKATALAEAGISQEQAIKAINRLGNLTLLSSRRNQQLSNRTFSEKKAVYAKSDVAITRDLSSLDRWTLSEIEDRTKRFAAKAVELFPHPARIAG
jgi:hypothetical protein